jgi:hypothetical protein
MSGSPSSVWLCLVGGMLLQLTYMILPFQRWDWARYPGSAALPVFMIAKADNDHAAIGVEEGLLLCGMFTLMFALLFQERLLPRLGEGVIPEGCGVCQWLDRPVALALVLGIALFAYLNHWIGLMPDRTFAALVLFALPVVWQAVFLWLLRWRSDDPSAPVMPTMPPTTPESTPREGIGRARHSRKHRQS